MSTTRLLLFLTAMLLGAAGSARAHPGGHGFAEGADLHVWTDPASGAAVPGSLLFVANGEARIEDVTGRVHTWPLSALGDADRALAIGFRARVEALNGVRMAPMPADGRDSPVAPSLWVALLAVSLGVLIVWRLGLASRVLVRVPAASLALALPLACGGSHSATTAAPTSPTPVATAPSATSVTLPLASYFASFPTHVRTRQDAQNLYVESDGLADHVLMTGIRSWQQQVPLPQTYTGANAYTIPLTARLADRPVSARTALFNGAIALAVNGVPIFNALNNRGDDAFLFGELDDFGGHSGRADDYHYHAAPFMLEATVGNTKPIAVALDGFPLYGSAEPDGSGVRALDEYNGHADTATVYHYHGTRTYPYINGGMRGVVRVVDDHVDPQPSLRPVRPAGTPLAGAVVTGFASTGASAWRLEYRLNAGTYRVDYRVEGTRYTFVFTDPSGVSRTETYTR